MKKILIANRSDTAVRIIRACKEKGFLTVAVHSSADDNNLHVKLADESVRIGDGPANDSYLNKQRILAAADITRADAIHPGIGFLSEDDGFAQMVIDHGLIFIGPKPNTIRDFGSKITARKLMQEHGLDVVPGTIDAIHSIKQAHQIAQQIGYPFMFKGAWCGGGKGIRLVENEQQLEQAFNLASAEADKFSNKLDIYIEKYISNARHIEIQVVCDQYGNCIHLGERDCSIQRNHQKVWEEAPSTILTSHTRSELGEKVCNIMRKIGYLGVGTVEFLYDLDTGKSYFMEMNTRLQVEHTITEEITGLDLVHLQLMIAKGDKLPFTQKDIILQGHAIECRITAEDPITFMPSPLQITGYEEPKGKGIRIESCAFTGYHIPQYYDSLLAKLIVKADTRELALVRMKQALSEYRITGPKTTLSLHQALCINPDIQNANFNTNWLSKWITSSNSF